MGFLDFLRKPKAKAPEPTQPADVNVGPIGVRTVADYLHYIGNLLDVNLKDTRNFRGRMVDLSDDGSKLILSDVTEYRLGQAHEEVMVGSHRRVLLPIGEINVVEVKDRGIEKK